MLLLLRSWGKRGSEAQQTINSLLDRYESRHLLKRCFVGTRQDNKAVQDAVVDAVVNQQDARRAMETEIAEALNISDSSQVILYCPQKEMQLKEAGVLVRRTGRGIRPLRDYTEEFPFLSQLVQGYRDLWKLYVFVPFEGNSRLRDAGTTVESILNRRFPGLVNRYRT
jgi:HD superfamily phosphohydrolase